MIGDSYHNRRRNAMLGRGVRLGGCDDCGWNVTMISHSPGPVGVADETPLVTGHALARVLS